VSAIDIKPLPSRFGTDTTAWRLEDRGDAVEAIPRLPIGYLIGVWVVAGFLYTAALLVFPRVRHVPAPLWYGFFFGVPVIVVGAHVMAYVSYRNGLRFLIDRVKSTFTLPNVQKSWPLANVVGWQIVNYMSGPGRRNEDRSSQLIVVIQVGDTVARYLVFTGIGRSMPWRFRELVEQVAALTPVKLVSYVEDGVEKVDANS
jgi:hypothetical protein